MGTAILWVWGIGLAAALLATLVILKQVSVALRTLRHILELAERTREAARGLADFSAASSRLEAVGPPLAGLREATAEVAAAADAIGRRLDGPGPGPASGG
jgi:hypothetical protein